MVEIKEMFVPVGSKRRSGKKLKGNRGVTIHEAGTPNAPAVNHAKNQCNNCNAVVNGWHFTVDDQETWQSFPLDEVAEHSGKREGNDTTVAIEIADKTTSGEYWNKAVDNAAQLAAWILKQKGFTKAVWKENLFQHNDWSGKDCPYQIRRGNPMSWTAFVALVNQYMGNAQPEPEQAQGQYEFALSQLVSTKSGTEDEIRAVQRTLLDLGYELGSAGPDKNGVDGVFGTKTKKAVYAFQRDHRLKEDGVVGENTCEALNGRWDG